MRRLLDWFMGIGIVLLPFTTTPFGEKGIVSYGEMVLLVWSIFAAIYLLMKNPTITKSNQPLIVVSFWLMVLEGASLLWVPDYLASGLRMIPVIIGCIMLLYVLSAPNRSMRVTERYLKLLFLGGFTLAIAFLAHFVQAAQQYSVYELFMDRVVGGKMALQWGASNLIAANLLLFPLIGLYLGASNKRPIAKAFYFGASGLQTLAMLLTLSRNAILSMIVAIGILFVLGIFKSRQIFRWVFSLLILTVIVLVVLGVDFSILWQQIVFRFTSSDILTLNGRFQIWADTWQAYLTSPLLGIGYYGSLAKIGHSAHDIWLLTLTENGPVALFLRIALYWLIIRRLYLALKHDKSRLQRATMLPGVLLAILISSLVNMTFEDVLLNAQYIIYSWMFYGICWAAASRAPTSVAVGNDRTPPPLRGELASGGAHAEA